MDNSISRIKKEIAEYEAEARRFEQAGNQPAAKTCHQWKESLERKLEVIQREGIWTP